MKILDENGLLYLWQKIKAVISKTTGIPTNGIIDYEGDTIPEGYEEVNDDADWQWLSQEYGLLYRKKGNVVILEFSSLKYITLNGWATTVLTQLPSNIRPNFTLKFAVYSKGNANVYGEFNLESGNIMFFNWGEEATFEAGQLAFTLTYFV